MAERAKAQAAAPKKTPAEEKEDWRATMHSLAMQDDNINPLVSDMTNRDIFRTMLFTYGTDNYIPVDAAADHMVKMIYRR